MSKTGQKKVQYVYSSIQCQNSFVLNVFGDICFCFQFLQDLLDSLFYILMQNMISDLYDNLVFDALVSNI